MKTFVSFDLMPDSSIVELRPKDKTWPKLLSEIPNPPKKLYCRGNLKLLRSDCFGIVGSRKYTPYGQEAVQSVIGGLIDVGFVIVSGLALGIDGIAHQTTIEFGGKTIAVLGSGIDDKTIYPRNHIRLATEILKKDGLIISEYPAGFRATEWTFPQRNRIISGLSRGILVVEADQSSGALITAQYALEQNRDVFAIPGSIFSAKSIGPNSLIRRGAKLVASARDIINEYGYDQELFNKKRQTTTDDPTENKIFELLNDGAAMSVDRIVELSNIQVPKIMATLSILEITGRIKNLGNGKYRKI